MAKHIKKFFIFSKLYYNIYMRYLIKISYDGARYCGWQKQNKGVSIEGVLEDTIKRVLGKEVKLNASGRTDAGVSAIMQTAHFDVDDEVDKSFVGHVNVLLPSDIKLLSCERVCDDFHARYDVVRKTYKYNFYLSNQSIPFYDRFCTQIKSRVDIDIFRKNMTQLLGTHDFTAFCASNSSVVDKTRTIYSVDLKTDGMLCEFSICGSGFLYNMVRIIVGTLVDLASGKIDGSMTEIILSCDRTKAGRTLSGKGLTLQNVEYLLDNNKK